MTTAAPLDLDSLNAQITKQASEVRQLKKDGATSESIASAVSALQNLKISMENAIPKNESKFPRKAFDELLLRKMFVVPSFEIHGGVKGLFDLGPPACALKASMVEMWREHFVLTESMLEMECTCLTPAAVLKTSGHVERFTDLMVKDTSTGECFRADKLLEDAIDQLLSSTNMSEAERDEHMVIQRQADAFTSSEIDELLLKYSCLSPSGTPYGKSFPFNLMFETRIGPEGSSVGYLRPETAQGLFCNFRRLLDLNAQKMPFAAAQLGLGFRNEIAPRSGLLRVREFLMAEIEHFFDRSSPEHPSFPQVENVTLTIFPRDNQLTTGKTLTLPLKEIYPTYIQNQTLAYFMARTQLYVISLGMDPKCLRFRQHLSTEMAHYASDCWDLEILMSYGWIECVGHADRDCYDLLVHGKATKTNMLATIKYDKPQLQTVAKLKLNRKVLGSVFKKDQRAVGALLEDLAKDWSQWESVANALDDHGQIELETYLITKEMVSWEKITKQTHEKKFVPSVIEPSFGMGRILYALMEHSFYQRPEDEQRCVMRFNPRVAPYKCAVLPISSHDGCNAIVDALAKELMKKHLFSKVDKSGAALGRRYARVDETGIPFAITVDFQSLVDGTVTVRERDSMEQIRLGKGDAVALILDFVNAQTNWDVAKQKYPLVEVKTEGDGPAPVVVNAGATFTQKNIRGRFSRPVKNILS